jgi:hypothetical protein
MVKARTTGGGSMRTSTLLGTLFVISAFATVSLAQVPEPGDLGIFFDVGGTQTSQAVSLGSPFSLWAVAFDVPGGVEAYEMGLRPDPRAFLVGAFFPAPIIILPIDPLNFVVGTGGVCLPDQGPVQLVQWTFILLTPPVADLLFCLLPYEPSSFDPPSPGYVTCLAPDDLRPFGMAQRPGSLANYPVGCAVGNPTNLEPPVAGRDVSWGSMKSHFGAGD